MPDSFRKEVDVAYRRVHGFEREDMMAQRIASELVRVARDVSAVPATDILVTKNALVGRSERVVAAVNRESVLFNLSMRMNQVYSRKNMMLITFSPRWKEDKFINKEGQSSEVPVSAVYRRFVEKAILSSFGDDVLVQWKDDICWIKVSFED